jgi:hypothetical protein
MIKGKKRTVKPKNKILNAIPALVILMLIVGIPLLFLSIQSKHSGMSWSETIRRIGNKSGKKQIGTGIQNKNNKTENIHFLSATSVGQASPDKPQISNLQSADLDKDGLLDIIVCDTKGNFISWIRQNPKGVFSEIIIAEGVIAPAHSQVIDFDRDGDNDILVAVLGMLFPSNDKIGSVVLLENDGKLNFSKKIIVEKIARVSDVRGGDLDHDGDMDLAVAQFGYDDGQTRWIENLGNGQFKSHILQNISGPINVEIVDIDRDGDMDIISLVSQEWEEIYCYINDGKGNFQPKLIYGSSNEDFGSSGIYLCDADQDGDQDILYTNGDAFDYIPPVPRPWHGVNWLENTGNLAFTYHRLADFAGAYNARPVDIDNDGDLDIFVVSGFNFWERSESQSFIWLENDGHMQFKVHGIANNPTHLLTLEPGDYNNDGKIDFITGGMYTYPPYDRMSRITLWLNKGF